MKHDISEEGETAREQTSQESVRGDSTGRNLLEGIDEVIQGGLEDGKEPEAHADSANDRSDPMDMGITGPGEDEEASGEDNRAEHHWW